MMETNQQNATQAAINILAKSSVRELRQIRVDGSANELQLSGSVRSFYHKQLAQETVRSVAAGMQLVNRVDVCAKNERDGHAFFDGRADRFDA
jgi:osmotically-inducible protein OsmY